MNATSQNRVDAIVARHLSVLDVLSRYPPPKPRPRKAPKKRNSSYPKKVGEQAAYGRGMFDPVLDAVSIPRRSAVWASMR